MSGPNKTLVLDLVVPGNPVPKGRPRLSQLGRTMTPPRTRQAETDLGWKVKEAMAGSGGPDDAMYLVQVEFHENRQPHQAADADNCQKLVGDALNGIVWNDDIQIVEWHVVIERGSPCPRTHLRIFRIEEN